MASFLPPLLRFISPLVMISAPLAQAGNGVPEWAQVKVAGEDLWEIRWEGHTARVSQEKARLVHLSTGDGPNLLRAPKGDPGDLGAHRFWLGPQRTWPKQWPPPAEWEKEPATMVKVGDPKTLRLIHPRNDQAWPGITRTYRLTDEGALECAAEWPGGVQSAQAMHILQLNPDAEAVLETAPEFYGIFPPGGQEPLETDTGIPPRAKSENGALVLKCDPAEAKSIKLAFPLQKLTARFPGGEKLEMSPAAWIAETAQPLDEGCYTQVYIGDSGFAVLEIEQMTPLLDSAKDATVRASILLRISGKSTGAQAPAAPRMTESDTPNP